MTDQGVGITLRIRMTGSAPVRAACDVLDFIEELIPELPEPLQAEARSRHDDLLDCLGRSHAVSFGGPSIIHFSP